MQAVGSIQFFRSLLDNMIGETTAAFSRAEQQIVREDSEMRAFPFDAPSA